MSFDPLAVATVPADEHWDETLDVLAQAAARDLGERGLLRARAEDAVRYHIRSFARRLVYPLLDQVHAEIRTCQQETIELRRENARLRTRLTELGDSRRSGGPLTTMVGGVWMLLVLLIGVLLYAAWSGTQWTSAPEPPSVGSAIVQPAAMPPPQDGSGPIR